MAGVWNPIRRLLQIVDQRRLADDLRLQPLGGQEHDGEVGGVRRLHVLAVDILGRQADRTRERFGGQPSGLDVAEIGGVLDADVILLREFGVDGQPHAGAGLVLGARQADGELDHLGVAGLDVDVLLELPGRQDLVEQGAQLHLGPGAPSLHVGEHTLEIADARGEALHLAEALLHGLELVAHQLERLAETFLEGDVQLLVDRLAHLLEFLLVAFLELAHACVQSGTHTLERRLIGLAELLEAA